jgi:hypothetical protein
MSCALRGERKWNGLGRERVPGTPAGVQGGRTWIPGVSSLALRHAPANVWQPSGLLSFEGSGVRRLHVQGSSSRGLQSLPRLETEGLGTEPSGLLDFEEGNSPDMPGRRIGFRPGRALNRRVAFNPASTSPTFRSSIPGSRIRVLSG